MPKTRDIGTTMYVLFNLLIVEVMYAVLTMFQCSAPASKSHFLRWRADIERDSTDHPAVANLTLLEILTAPPTPWNNRRTDGAIPPFPISAPSTPARFPGSGHSLNSPPSHLDFASSQAPAPGPGSSSQPKPVESAQTALLATHAQASDAGDRCCGLKCLKLPLDKRNKRQDLCLGTLSRMLP